MTRLCLLAMLGLVPACLFVGDINQRPSVQLEALSTGTTLGVPITLDASIDDDQDDTSLKVVVLDEGGAVVDDNCVVGVTSTGTESATYTVVFWRVGTYTIEATPTDRYGAVGSSATVIVGVTKSPPTFADATDQLTPQLATQACTSLYPTGVVIPIAFESSVIDPEQSSQAPPSTCPNATPPPIEYTWHIASAPDGGGALGRAVSGSCPPTPVDPAIDLPDDDGLVCLYPAANLPTGMPSQYTIELDATDGTTVIRTSALSIPVIGDAPACLNGLYPEPGSYVLDRDMPTIFQAVGVDDVAAAATLAFTWSLERAGETTYTALGPSTVASDGGGRFVFDPTALGVSVGDDVELRVDVIDPANPPAACDASDDTCVVSTCAAAPATTCPRRATWSLEIR